MIAGNNNTRNDKKFRAPRIWSNNELRKIAHEFSGKVINVSARADEDKEGSYYRKYFSSASEYCISNYQENKNDWQDIEGEIFIDLEKKINSDLINKFDVVFNHTTLEHVYNCRKAFANLCLLSKDVVIVVVPYIQQLHGSEYGDYWRFTPYTVDKMYKENGVKLRYCSANGGDRASIYLFCVGYRNNSWDKIIQKRFDLKLVQDEKLYSRNYTNVIGGNVVC